MPLRAKSHYAAVAMLELAIRSGQEQPVALRDIAEEHDVPLPFLTQIVQHLKLAGLVISVRGASGGYRLKRSPASIRLGEIVAAVSPPRHGPDSTSSSPANRVLEEVWEEMERSNRERLDNIRLDQLVDRASQTNDVMFYI